MKEYNIEELNKLIDIGDVDKIRQYMTEHDLIIEGNRIVPNNKTEYKNKIEYWDLEQYLKKK